MWEFYLAASETAFRYQNLVVFQVQLERHVSTLPLTRDYIGEAELRMRAFEALNSKRRMAGE
jgi:cyclopropane-fatty-acyl-phospholipid synthase